MNTTRTQHCKETPSRLAVALADIKLHHSVFALPFAVLGAFLAAAYGSNNGSFGVDDGGAIDWPRFGGQLALVVACMVLARTWAMLVNRIADRRFDAANPRTAGRALPRGSLRAREAAAVAGAAAAGFALCCAGYWLLYANPWPTILALPTLAWIAFYSFTKRFTAWSHLFLGGALAASPIAATIAVEPAALLRGGVWLIALMVLLWVAGFDVLYALQDVAFDRSAGLCSLPAWLGERRAAWAARGMHGLAALALVGAWRVEPALGALFLGAAVIAAALLVLEHVIVAARGLAGLPVAFFTINGVVSVLLGVAGCMDAAM